MSRQRVPALALSLCLVSVVWFPGCSQRNPAYIADAGGAWLDVGGADQWVAPDRGDHDGPAVSPDRGRRDGPVVVVDTGPLPPDQKQPLSEAGPGADSWPWPDKGPNPNDVGPQPDVAVVPDASPAPDMPPAPDLKPTACTKDADCDDKIACTTDKCSPQGTCTHSIHPGMCLIAGICYTKGKTAPGNSCSVCDPLTADKAWSAKADGLACDSDNLSCTVDACASGKCVHTPASGTCAIGGACYKSGDLNPQNSCQACNGGASPKAWITLADGAACKLDGLSCTQDVCSKGQCVHNLVSGCLIGGQCRGEGDRDPSDKCKGCFPKVATGAYTYIAGIPCDTGGTNPTPGVCLANACMTPTTRSFEPAGNAQSTSLRSVAYIDNHKRMWAAGESFAPGGTGSAGVTGVLLDVASTLTSTPVFKSVGNRLRDLHHNLAVGLAGKTWYHTGTAWVAATPLDTALKGWSRLGVWGRDAGSGAEGYIITGDDVGGASAIVACNLTLGSAGVSAASCANHTGVTTGDPVAFVMGTVTSTGGQGPLWATIMGNNTLEDIYYNAGTTTTWSTASPTGCKDAQGSPCGNTSNNLFNMDGSGSDDLWVVGSQGMILHYDGKVWQKEQNVVPTQTAYDLTAVFPIPGEDVVFFVARRANGWRFITYNKKHKLWSGPAILLSGNLANDDWIFDVSGTSAKNLWMVGQRRTGSGGSQEVRGLVVTLQ